MRVCFFLSILALAACANAPATSSSANGSGDADAGALEDLVDAGASDAASDDVDLPLTCGPTATGSLPVRLALPHGGDNGVFDASLELDPQSGRLWMAYASVDGSAGDARVSTYLAFSEDGGATWCTPGAVSPARRVGATEAPPALSSRATHWNAEVPALVRDPQAPAAERWKLLWHRYLVAVDEDPNTDDRQFQFGWIALKAAATPLGLFSARERKLFSARLYHLEATVEAYNDAIVGPPEAPWSDDSALGPCLALTEAGAVAANGNLYVSLTCRTQTQASAVLLAVDRTQNTDGWRYVGTLLSAQDAQAILDRHIGADAPSLIGVSATALFMEGDVAKLSVSPVGGDGAYRGCWIFEVDLATGRLIGSTSPPLPSVVEHSPGTFQSGMCAYDAAATAWGIVFGETHTDGVQFRLFGTDRRL